MSTQPKYRLVVKDGDVQLEEGHFFKAWPFEIRGDGFEVSVEFKHIRDAGKRLVVQHVSVAGGPTLELRHPDYVPDYDVQALDTESGFAHLSTLFAALCRVQVSTDAAYQKYFGSDDAPAASYEVLQHVKGTG